jgi:hypothetical protein
MKYAIWLALWMLVAGCATVPQKPAVGDYTPEPPPADNSKYINTVLPAWIGQKASDLIEAWGQPTEATDVTPGSYSGRGKFRFHYHIGDTGKVMVFPGTSAYSDTRGNMHIRDATTIAVPHVVKIYFVSDVDGIVIYASWWGIYTDKFNPSLFPMPKQSVGKMIFAPYAANDKGGAWRLDTAEQAERRGKETTAENILEKLSKP